MHQVPPRARQAKQGPLRAVLQKDPGIRNQEKSRSQTGQVDQGVSLSHAHRAKKARRKSGLLFAVSQTGRRATMDHAPAGDKNDGEHTVAARICMATVHPSLTIAHLYQRVCYTGLTATTSEERGLTIAHLYQRVCYTGLTATTSEERGLTIAHLYQRVCYMGLTATTSEERGLTIAHLCQRVCYTGLTATTSEERGLTIAHLYQRVCYTSLTATTSTTSEAQVKDSNYEAIPGTLTGDRSLRKDGCRLP